MSIGVGLVQPTQIACPTGPHMGLAWAGLGLNGLDLVNGPRLGPIWASPFSFFSKYDIIVLNITQWKGCLVMSLGIDNHESN